MNWLLKQLPITTLIAALLARMMASKDAPSPSWGETLLPSLVELIAGLPDSRIKNPGSPEAQRLLPLLEITIGKLVALRERVAAETPVRSFGGR